MYRIVFTYEEMIDSIKNISDQLSKSKFDPDIIISVNRGGCIPGIYLSHYKDKPHEAISIQFRNSDKDPNTKSIEKKIKNYNSVLIIDDINDSGRTISFIKELCKKLNIDSYDLSLLPKHKSTFRENKKHWSEYYDDETKNIVYNKHKKEFELFGYDSLL